MEYEVWRPSAGGGRPVMGFVPQFTQCFQAALGSPVVGAPSPHSHLAGEVGISDLCDHGGWGG